MPWKLVTQKQNWGTQAAGETLPLACLGKKYQSQRPMPPVFYSLSGYIADDVWESLRYLYDNTSIWIWYLKLQSWKDNPR